MRSFVAIKIDNLTDIIVRLLFRNKFENQYDYVIKSFSFGKISEFDFYFGDLKALLNRKGKTVVMMMSLYNENRPCSLKEKIEFIKNCLKSKCIPEVLFLPWKQYIQSKIKKTYYRTLAEHIKTLKAKKVIFTYEGSHWESDFVQGLNNMNIISIGYMHSPIKSYMYFKKPFPGIVLTTGPKQTEILKEKTI